MQREEARKKFREAKERRSGALRSKAARYTTPSASVRINGLLETPYSPDTGVDTGADKSVVPRGVFDSLRAMQPTLQPTALLHAVEAVMADGRTQMCDLEVLLDLDLTTLTGRVLLHAVPCLILAGAGDEFLLGRDVLKGLGIDVEQQLAQFAGPSLLEDETDEFPVGDSIADDQVAAYHVNGFDQMIDRAAANGMPPEHLNTVPYRSPPRKYAPLQAQFIREYVQTSVDNGLVEQNNASRSASDVVPVRKPGTQDQFRLTIDYRSVNGMTVPIAGTMPSVATTTDGFQNKKVFGRVDFTQGFWQLPLDEASRAIFTFITPDGVFTPCRVPQGAMDSTLHFQSQVQTKLAPLIPHSALVWVYDVILFAPTVQEFLMTLRAFFEIVKLNMAKSSLIELECLWCGQHGTPQKLLLFTDASAAGYSIVVMQVRQWDASLPVDEQQHELIVCKGGMFKHSELSWTVVEKEAYPIVKACHDLDYLLLRPNGFRLYCDHANLAYIFAPSCRRSAHPTTPSRPIDTLSRLRPLGDGGFVFPTRSDIQVAQQAASRELSRLQTTSVEVDGVVMINYRMRIPGNAKDLLARIFVVAHCGSQGHRGQEPMLLAPKERFYITKLEDKVAKFVRQLDQHEWPYLLPAAQANLNHARVHSLAGRAPVEVFTALPAASALDAIVVPATSERGERVVDLDSISEHVNRLRSSLHDIHQKVVNVRERQRLRDMAAHHGNPANLDVGDFVLWSRIHQRLPNHKLLVIGYGTEVRGACFLPVVLCRRRTGHDYGAARTRVKPRGSDAGSFPFRGWDVPTKVRDYVNASGDDELRAQLDE
ncbi:hypothetical protein ON010_g13238 [Phytophthora cinnamomi]|nr:hypothetical protein ON010_g13238 [Phytophthora cinnamomi]